MNKKAIFIPILLLAMQPNKILSADNTYEQAREAFKKASLIIEGGQHGMMGESTLMLRGKVFYSDHPETQKLIDEFVITDESGLTFYPLKYNEIFKRYYPNFKLKIREASVQYKPAKQHR